MKDKLYIQSRLLDLNNVRPNLSEEASLIHKGQLDTIRWVLHGGDVRPENEIKQRLVSCIDELKAYTFSHNDVYCKVSVAKIKELNSILED